MRIEIGNYEVISGADTITVFAMQIGVTRIGSGGRCQPRTRRGAMASVANLVTSTVDPETLETEIRPSAKVTRKIAHAGRAVVALAVLVVGLATQKVFNWLAGIGRVLYCAIMGRPGSMYHRQPWGLIYREGITECW